MQDERSELLRQIKYEVVDLIDSPLYPFRTTNQYFPVIGQGNHYARIMFIGEAPGENEAKYGRPFCGAAGRVLDELLDSINLSRDEVYITNILKDRPPNNREPEPTEIELYAPFLYRQISIIQPDVLVTLGRHAMTFILDKLKMPQRHRAISSLHGTLLRGHAQYGEVYVVPLFHPAVALYDPDKKATLMADFQILRRFVEG